MLLVEESDDHSHGTGADVVLMDIDLGPGIDGTEAIERILEARDVPVVLVTSHFEKSLVDNIMRITRYG